MKKYKILKIMLIVFIIFCSVTSVVNTVFGYDWNFNQFDGKSDSNISGKAVNIMGAIVDVVRIVGTGIALIMIIFVAIKYMTSAPGERADIKKHAIPFVVGAIILFASSNILGIIRDFAISNTQ